jgi:hypothetical protein
VAASEDQTPAVVSLPADQAAALRELGPAIKELAGRPIVVDLHGLSDSMAEAASAMKALAERPVTAPVINIPAPEVHVFPPPIQIEFPEVVEELEVTSRDADNASRISADGGARSRGND